jgi:hypothetical protein
MSSSFRTGDRILAGVAQPVIEELGRDLLTEEKLAWGAQLCSDLLGTASRRRTARLELIVTVPREPSRPLFYLCSIYIPRLPRYTRDVVRSSANYIDLLVKELAAEMLGRVSRKQSLGANAAELMRRGPGEQSGLFERLQRFDRFLYVPAKHDFSLPAGRYHRFTLREAVLSVQVCIELGKQILEVSQFARNAVREDDRYSMGSEGTRWRGVHYHPPEI